MLGRYEYTQQHHAELQARGEDSLGREARAQLHARQQLARELEAGRAATEKQAAPSKSWPRRNTVKQHAADYRCCVLVCFRWYYVPSSSEPEPHSLRLDLHKTCFTGGAAVSCCRPPAPRSHKNRAIRSRPRARVHAAGLRSGLDCALSSSTFRATSKLVYFFSS